MHLEYYGARGSFAYDLICSDNQQGGPDFANGVGPPVPNSTRESPSTRETHVREGSPLDSPRLDGAGLHVRTSELRRGQTIAGDSAAARVEHEHDLIAAPLDVRRLQHRGHLLAQLRDLRGRHIAKELEDVHVLGLARRLARRGHQRAERVEARRPGGRGAGDARAALLRHRLDHGRDGPIPAGTRTLFSQSARKGPQGLGRLRRRTRPGPW